MEISWDDDIITDMVLGQVSVSELELFFANLDELSGKRLQISLTPRRRGEPEPPVSERESERILADVRLLLPDDCPLVVAHRYLVEQEPESGRFLVVAADSNHIWRTRGAVRETSEVLQQLRELGIASEYPSYPSDVPSNADTLDSQTRSEYSYSAVPLRRSGYRLEAAILYDPEVRELGLERMLPSRCVLIPLLVRDRRTLEHLAHRPEILAQATEWVYLTRYWDEANPPDPKPAVYRRGVVSEYADSGKYDAIRDELKQAPLHFSLRLVRRWNHLNVAISTNEPYWFGAGNGPFPHLPAGRTLNSGPAC